MTLNEIKNYISRKIAIILAVVIGFALLNILSFNLPVQAASTTLGSGTVSIDKYYVSANTEVKTLTTAQGDFVTVRLRYQNTASISDQDVVLSDALPSPKFEYIPGTLKNCLISSANCATLNDGLWSGLNLATSTSAGFYGYSGAAPTGNLEFGRSKYAHLVTCSQPSGSKESFIQSIDDTSIFAASCGSVSGSSVIQDYSSIQILGQRYLHQTVCGFSGGEKEIFTQSVDNSASFTPDCSGLTGSSVASSSTLDLYSPANGGGYIEYKMKSDVVEDYQSTINTDIGEYGSNPSLVSSSFSTLTDNMASSLALKVYCDIISPTGGERNLTLADAELRANQDFRCVYQASLCPVVFEDVNSNGVYDSGVDTLKTGVQILLQNSGDNAVLASITSNNTTQCFPNLLHGRDYRLNISSPPTGVSTTGGDSKIQTVSYQNNQKTVEFGYANGSIILNVPASVVLPAIKVDSKPNDVSTLISPIQVIDTRLANPGWTVTASVNDFTSQAIPDSILRVANAFKSSPKSVTVNDGSIGGITIGDQKTVNSTIDTMNIFAGTVGNSKGNYQIDTNITLTVPSLTRASSYESVYTYTII